MDQSHGEPVYAANKSDALGQRAVVPATPLLQLVDLLAQSYVAGLVSNNDNCKPTEGEICK